MSLFKRTPAQKYKRSDKKIQSLRDKRSKLDPDVPWEAKKINKINSQIHEQKVNQHIADKEMSGNHYKKTNVTVNLNKNNSKKSVEFHGHYHSGKKK
ncbi:MAG: hypothetical protein NC131_21315 [Roseburia sp.]|nr:hypothetical protein [Roseburia sp.]